MDEGEAPRRARSMAEFRALQGRFMAPADMIAGVKAYRPRPTDIVISPAGKCGTTWLQQTFHTLRTRGDMDFDDISRVVPWIETSHGLGLDLEAPQRAEPRGFKSHMGWGDMPKGAKYIVSFRDPKDAWVSHFHFMNGWFLEPGSVSLAEYSMTRLGAPDEARDFWGHLLSWWAERDNPNVLLLSYEDMTANPEANIRRVADFCGLPLDDDLLALTLERTSLSYMLAHKDRFDDRMMREKSEALCNLPPGSDSAKVRKGGVGGHKEELTAEVASALDEKWRTRVAPVTGFDDYAGLEAAVRARLN
jgi:hypothetical protein